GQWDRAAAEFEQARQLSPTNNATLWYLSAARLHAGDLAGFHGARNQLLRRFGATSSPSTAEAVLRTGLLLPGAGGGLEAARERLARVAGGPTTRRVLLARALADYRAGRLAVALQALKRFNPKSDGGSYDATAFALLAVTQHRLGQARAAGEALG